MEQSHFVTREFILSQISQEDIFEFYFGQKIDLLRKYKSPLREDSSPGCSFYCGKSGDLLFYDPQEGAMDCFRFIMLKYSCSYYDSIIKIKLDFQLIKQVQSKIIVEEREPFLKFISIKRRDYLPEELEWWQIPDMVITQQDLENQGIFAISDLWYNYVYKAGNLKFTFAYKQKKALSYQIYRPLQPKSYRFRTNDSSYIYGLESLNYELDYVLINKCKKCQTYGRFLGWNTIGKVAEGYNIPVELIEFLRTKFKKIYICNDPDSAGKLFTDKALQNYPDLLPIFAQVGKDLTEDCKLKGASWVKEHWIL